MPPHAHEPHDSCASDRKSSIQHARHIACSITCITWHCWQVKFEDQSHLTGPSKRAKDIQYRIKQRLPSNASGAVVKQLFRSCQPDGCGYVSKGNFQRLCMESLGTTQDEASRLYRIADTGMTGELDITGFTRAIIGGSTELNDGPPTHRFTNAKDGAVYSRYGGGVEKAVKDNVNPPAPGGCEWMDRDATKLIRQMNHLLGDHKKSRELSQIINHEGEHMYDGDHRVGKTTIEIGRMGTEIERMGVPMSPNQRHKFHQLYGNANDEVTMSEIQAKTTQYAKQLDALKGNTVVPRGPLLDASLTHKGDYVGCRKLRHADDRLLEEKAPYGHDLYSGGGDMGGPGRPSLIEPRGERAAQPYREVEEVAWKRRLDPQDKGVAQPKRGHKNLVKGNRNHQNNIGGIMDWEQAPVQSPKPKAPPETPVWMTGGDKSEVGPLG